VTLGFVKLMDDEGVKGSLTVTNAVSFLECCFYQLGLKVVPGKTYTQIAENSFRITMVRTHAQ
jgi:hypothetical protein